MKNSSVLIKCKEIMKLDELTNKLMYEQTLGMELKCSNERLVDSFATLEVAHEVMVTVVKSYKEIDNTCSQNENKKK